MHGAHRDPNGGLRELDPARLPEYRDRLFRAAYALCRSRDDAEDLVQETYARVLRRPRLLRRDRDLAYLIRVLNNTWLNANRADRRRPPTLWLDRNDADRLADPGADPHVLVVTVRTTYEAVIALPRPFRDALVAVDILGLSYRQSASVLGVPVGTIMSRVHRARASVAESLRECDRPATKGSARDGVDAAIYGRPE